MNRIIKVKTAFISFLFIAMTVAGSDHFSVIGNTGNNMTLLVRKEIKPECNGEPMHYGDEIGVFTADGQCVGASRWNGGNTAITVWGDNTVTEAVDGAQGGETLTLRIWCLSRMMDCSAKAKSSSGDILYRTDGICILSSLSTDESPNGYGNKKYIMQKEQEESGKNSSGNSGNENNSAPEKNGKKSEDGKRLPDRSRNVIATGAHRENKEKRTNGVELLFPVNQTVSPNTNVTFRWKLRKKNITKIYFEVAASAAFKNAEIDSSIEKDDTVKTLGFERSGTFWWRLRVVDKRNRAAVCKAETFTVRETVPNPNYRMIVFEDDGDGKSYLLKYDIFEKSEVEFTVKNKNGKVVFKSRKINTPGLNTISVNTADLRSGVYNYALKNSFFSYSSSFEIPVSEDRAN
jgi:hypothetical protein